jgi:hypothetical protein
MVFSLSLGGNSLAAELRELAGVLKPVPAINPISLYLHD